MALRNFTRTHFQKLNPLTNQLIPISKFPNSKPISTTKYPQSSNLSHPNHQKDTHYRKQISLANIFQRYGFSPPKIHDFIAKNKTLLNTNPSELEQCMKMLFLSFKLHQDLIFSLICCCPTVLDLDFIKKWEMGIVMLGPFGSSSKVVRSVLEFSRRFQVGPDRFSGCVEVLRGLGFSDGTICKVFEEFPGVVILGEREIKMRIDFWTVLEMDMGVVDRIYNCFPRVLGYGVENRLKPLVNEFSSLGFDRRVVREAIVKEPRVLGLELGELSWCLELLRRLRCRESIKEEIFKEGEFKAGFAVKLRVECLCGYGLIRRDALSISKREPRLIIYDVEDIERKMEFLLERMKFSVDSLMDVPEYLGVNLDKQIVPRYNVIEYLRSRGGLGFEVGLRDIIKPTRLKFYNLYVKPYPECEKIYGRFSENVKTKSRHPTGLWKLFKPPKQPESKEDVKNLKSFTESLV